MNTIDTLIIGASAFGIGYALAQNGKQDILMTESGIVPAAEFCAALRCTPVPMGKPWSPTAAGIIAECRRRNILDEEGSISIPAVTSVLSAALYDAGIPVWLETSVADIAPREDGGFRVTLFENRVGFTEISCRFIVDTRAACPPWAENPPKCSRFMRALLCCDGMADSLPERWGAFTVQKGRFRDEYVLSLPIAETAQPCNDIPAARARFGEAWYALPHGNWKIAAMAAQADTVYPSPQIRRKGNCVWLPSCGFADVMTAVEEGNRWNFGA